MMAKTMSAYVKLPSKYCPPLSFSAALNPLIASCACDSHIHVSVCAACLNGIVSP